MIKMKRQYKFSNWWLTGFTQADGSFVVVYDKRLQGKMPYRPRPYFVLTQSNRDIEMIKSLHEYLGVGKLRIDRNSVNIVVRSIEDLLNVIIPHFDQYPPRGGKLVSYLIFRRVVLAIKDMLHTTPEGFIQIIDLCYFTHTTSYRTIASRQVIIDAILSKWKITFPIKPLIIDFIGVQPPINAGFLAGLIDGDGSISFSFSGSRRRVTSVFEITQGIDDYNVLLEIKQYFGCGSVIKVANKEAARFRMVNLNDIVNKIQPILECAALNTVKSTYVNPAIKVWNILQKKGIASDENLLQVVDLVYNINQEGKTRKITKESYIKNFIS